MSKVESQIKVDLNGAPVTLVAGAHITDAVIAAGVEDDARGVAVALDGAVVPRSEWHRTRLAGGCRIEVLKATQGG